MKKEKPNNEYFFQEGCFILELLNTPEDPDVSIARVRVKSGVTTRLHRLHGITERYLIFEGTGKIYIGDSSPRDISNSDNILIPESSPQKITNTGSSDLIFLAICTPRFVPEVYEDIDD